MRYLHILAIALSLAAGPAPADAQTPATAQGSPAPAEADEASEQRPPSSIRSLLVVDDPDGGAMTRQLTLSASMLYASLANKADAIGVYADSSAPIRLAPAPLSKATTFSGLRKALRALPDARPVAFEGLVGYAREAFRDRPPGVRDALVVLAHSPREGTAEPDLPASVGTELLQLGVRVFVVGFGDRVKVDAYRSLVEPSEGRAYQVTKGKELERAFSEIFTYLHDTEALPVVGDRIVMDESIGAATVVVPKRSRKERTRIITPGDRVLSARTKFPGVEWSSFDDYDLIKIRNPEAGTWRVDQPSKVGGVVGHVNASDLRLVVTVRPRSPMVSDLTRIEAFLERDGRPVVSYAQLKHLVMEAEIRDPAGRMRPVRLTRTDRGFFEAEVQNEIHGYHEVRLTAFSPDVQRERRLTYLVNPACFQGRFAAESGAVYVDLSRTCPRFAELYARLVVERDGETIHDESFRREGNQLVAAAPRPALGQSHVVRVVIEGRTLDGHEVRSTAGGPFEDVAREPGLADYVKAVAERLALINIPFVVGLVGLVVVRQARRGLRGPTIEDEAEEER